MIGSWLAGNKEMIGGWLVGNREMIRGWLAGNREVAGGWLAVAAVWTRGRDYGAKTATGHSVT